jgi:hypothetical protein
MTARATAIAALALALATASVGAGTGPAIVVPERTRDLGTVRQGETVEAVFEVSNTGDEALEITVKPTCGCTVVDHDPAIAPGESGRITARIDTATLSGAIAKSLLVTSNDPTLGPLTLTVRADVEPAG